MIPVTSWTPEFCTVCDKECVLGSVYCSDECRETDYKKSVDAVRLTATGSPHTTHMSMSELETTDSSEDDDIDRFVGKPSYITSVKNVKPLQQKKKEFLYASPVLKPTKAPTISPNMSPILMPQAAPELGTCETQSVSTYKRWLADSGMN